ncbi:MULTISPECIES: hypothetical protein [Burkholderia cepacia complex]|uniref:hypothetical protein n=1 Tax=Burkholderia cepacia complex TaxID=87882 RepID=UPI0023DDE68E|nr:MULTISPECIES: hypothetical protein [Burkholderia cepacia complex]MDF3090491.1 hypothetical protein [Burkholderia semiarida]MDF3103278.1 hypothetical protein [Burkholderia semiarida]
MDEKKPAAAAGFTSTIAFLGLSRRTESIPRPALRRDHDRCARNIGDAPAERAHHARRYEQRDHPFFHFVLPLEGKGRSALSMMPSARQKLKLTLD